MIKKHTDIAERYAYRKQHDDVLYRHTLQHSQKLEFYSIFKSDYTPPVYLDFPTRKIPDRSSLVTGIDGLFKLHIIAYKMKYNVFTINKIIYYNCS